MPSTGMWRHVDLVWTDVSEECTASVFRVENPRARNHRELDFSTLKMEAIRSQQPAICVLAFRVLKCFMSEITQRTEFRVRDC
jgi:hypothetical protein